VPAPSASEIQAKAAEIVARNDYQLEAAKEQPSWSSDLFAQLIEWILVPLKWIYNATEGLPEFTRWIIVGVLVVLVLLLTGHIVYSLAKGLGGGKTRKSGGKAEVAERRIDPQKLESLADEAAAKHDFITAVRLLFRAGVIRIEAKEEKKNRPGATNRELLRRYQKQPTLGAALRLFVDTIDRKWYGDEICTDTDYAACRSAHDDVRRLTRGKLDVHGA
jgi:hypothetical protein